MPRLPNPLDDMPPAAQEKRRETLARMKKAGVFFRDVKKEAKDKPQDMWSESSPPPWANQDESTPAAPTDAQVRAQVLRYQASSNTDADADVEKKKAYAASIPLAFEKEANDIVATKQLEPWSRIGFLHIASRARCCRRTRTI